MVVGFQEKPQERIPVEIEVRSLKELTHLMQSSLVPDRILLDNFPVRELKKAVSFVKRCAKHPLLEASGGVHLANVRAVAKTGVDRISIGRLTHSAPAIDFSLDVTL